jgi:LuxR family maltose regulon positive regulatory protein
MRLTVTVLAAGVWPGLDQKAVAPAELPTRVEPGFRDGFVRVFTDEGPEVARLLRRLADSDSPAYVLSLVATVEKPDRVVDLVPRFQVEPLTGREQAVLRHLRSKLSNLELAGELCVSVNTLKTHLKSIYRKLDASSRSEAVSHARAWQLI